jgi:serine/threonine-protein kinase
MIGQKLGGYAVTGKLGEGGMGVVYRATDSRLHREVALKVLPVSLARDPQFMARFEREAHVLASLNHPHIASIYGLEDSEGQRALVMELVEGEDLAERLAHGPLPLDETLRIARQLAEALEAAHDKGVIHRDLKPANIKITPDGNVKVLDFGLAKALLDVGASSSPDLTRSPTISMAATQAGMILGTAGYMSPEQARAQPADRRADVWSFGVILFEMLGGRRAFAGETISDTLAKVLERDPDWSTLPADTPPALRRLLERCLVKNPRQRLQSIGDARIAIEELLADPKLGRGERKLEAPAAAPAWRRALPWALVAAATVWAVVASVGALGRSAAPPAKPPLRMSVQVGDDKLFSVLGAAAELSPDGKWVAYSTGEDAGDLNLRSLDRLESTLLVPGLATNGAYHPFFSPDSRWIGYVTPSELRKIPVTGGTSLALCAVNRSRGATWLPDDTIVFADSPSSGLSLVPGIGGEPKPLTTLDEAKKETTHRWPQALPGGKAVLFTSHDSQSTFDRATIEVVVVETGERKVVHRGGSYARYTPSGHLVFVNQSTLFSAPFDLERLELDGSPAPVLAGVESNPGEGGAQFSFSDDGMMLYVEGSSSAESYAVLAADRDGATSPLWPEPGTYVCPRFSPDGKWLAMTVMRADNWDIWTYDLERGVATRLTFDPALETEQVWSPDGEYLVYSSDAEGIDNMYRKRADGSGEAERLFESKDAQWASSFSPDGRFLAYTQGSNNNDVGVLSLEGSEPARAEPFVATPFAETTPDFSPDGRYIAYASTESGRFEVYVRPFPAGKGKWQVSDAGGSYALWSGDGRELYWRTDEGVMVADVETDGATFRAGKPRQLFAGAFQGGIGGIAVSGYSFPDYDVSADGRRFVVFPDPHKEGRGTHPHLILVTDWFEELRRTFARTSS